MNDWLWWAITFIICQRGVELFIAHKNTQWAQRQGGVEVGQAHYPLLVGLHTLFILGLVIEGMITHAIPPVWWPLPFACFLGAQGLRIWVFISLRRYWNTRIWVIPGHQPVARGPYRWLRHPNYVVVAIEILTLPLIFGIWVTALVTSLLNAWVLLRVRIPAEEKALIEHVSYARRRGIRRFSP